MLRRGRAMATNVSNVRPHHRRLEAPAPLRELPAWLMWRYEQFDGEAKPRKVPYYVAGMRRHGEQGAAHDRAGLTTFSVAREAAARKGYDGVGLALLPDLGIAALDFDKCVDADGNIPDEILAAIGNTYAEYSPSGVGIRAFFKGDLTNDKAIAKGDDYGLECFSTKGYVTFSGDALDHVSLLGLEDRVAPVTDAVQQFFRARLGASAMTRVDPDDFMAGFEHKLGLSIERTQEILEQLDPDMTRSTWIKVGMALHHEFEGCDEGLDFWDEWSSGGGRYPGRESLERQWDSFTRRVGSGQRQTTMATVIWMTKKPELRLEPLESQVEALVKELPNWVEGGVEWAVPAPLNDALPPVPPMEAEMLPAELRAWLVDIGGRMNVPLDFLAIPCMVMLAGVVGRKIAVRPEQHTDWSEVGNLWGVTVAPPGAMKTPATRQVFEPICALETEAQERNARSREAHQRDLIVHNVNKKRVEKALNERKQTTEGRDPMEVLMELAIEPKPAPEKRYMTSDATVEKLGEICADNPNGVLVWRDELPTFLTELDKDDKAASRGFMMTGWTGQDSYTFDRISRGTIRITAVNVSLFGTAQPERMANYIANSLAKHADGLVQRLQLLCWPDQSGEWVPADRPPDASAREMAFDCCKRLANLDPQAVGAQLDPNGKPPFLRFSHGGRALFNEWRKGHEAKVRGGELSPALAAHLAKYRGLVPRLALILHLAGGGAGDVSEEAVSMALRWARYLEAHARRAYAALDAENADAARLIWTRIERGELEDGFTARDIHQKGWSGLHSIGRVRQALQTLIEHEWLIQERVKTPGRPKDCYHINPIGHGRMT